ncbi:hypothetical protein HOP50_15g75960 [Chloropicon primus]|nr:hypothetical protein HOP50_15g75960 [Chloropicon primus]
MLGLSGEKGPAETCEWAAYGGHLDVLKWARSQDLPPPCGSDPDSCIESSEENGNDDIADADWIEANRGSDEEEEGFGSSSDNKPTNLRKKATKAMLNKVPFL